VSDTIDSLLKEFDKDLASIESLNQLNDLKVQCLGKKGSITSLLQSLGSFSKEERPAQGKKINIAKQSIVKQLNSKKDYFENIERDKVLQQESVDITLEGRNIEKGSLHPVTLTLNRINKILGQLGFEVAQGPEIEDDYHNFEALNIPAHHPARAMHDTFYLEDGHVLRTHTSPVQVRVMENNKPPFKITAPGRVYRCDSDLTHTPMFHQVEGLYVDKNVTFSHLMKHLEEFLHIFFEKDDLKIRFRPSYFPFTEPSAEADMECVMCGGDGCRVCSHTGWLEILGCGMVHPNVFKSVGIDSDVYSGYAFGMGVERLTMLYYGINDLRLFFENDYRFLKQFSH
jgi:phenylalanyl-tRNA synthetase alpha chain